VWLPEGIWWDIYQGARIHAGSHDRHYLLDEVPVFVRSGEILVGQPFTLRASEAATELHIQIWPGDSGEYCLYEDDGRSLDYTAGKSVWLPIRHRSDGSTVAITLGPARGSYQGFLPARSIVVRLAVSMPVTAATAGETSVPAASIHYRGDRTEAVVTAGPIDLRNVTTILLEREALSTSVDLSGLPGLMRRLDLVRLLATAASSPHPVHEHERLIVDVAQTVRRLELKPSDASAEVERLRAALVMVPPVMGEYLEVFKRRRDGERLRQVTAANAVLQGALRDFPQWFGGVVPHIVDNRKRRR
jgi:hypothetical protein